MDAQLSTSWWSLMGAVTPEATLAYAGKVALGDPGATE
jgi:hypothetical protein